MSRKAPALAAAAGLLAAVLTPSAVAAHAIGGTFQLPVPLWLFLAGAGIAVGASFVIIAVASRHETGPAAYATRSVPPRVATATRIVLRVLGMAWWFGAIAAGIAVGDISPLPAVLLWIGIWVGLPIVAVLAGNPWPSLSPFRTTFAALEWVAGRTGLERLDLGLGYPQWLARWPAVALLAGGIWAELILPGGEVAGTVAAFMIGYTLLTLLGMLAFGPVAWLRHAELFEVELGWFGRIGPLTRRSVSGELCGGCGESCDPQRCRDCPECAVAADDDERRPGLRPWVVGLTDVARPGWSDAAFIVLALAGVTYDGMAETAAGATLFNVIYPVVSAVLGPTSAVTFLLVETLELGAVLGALLLAFVTVVAATRVLSGRRAAQPLGSLAGRYAATLLPIAGGYLMAHYLTLVLQGAIWLPTLLADPLMSVAPQIDGIPIAAIWYLSVAAIVGGHVAGIVLAHRLTVADAPARATVAGLPMVALMIGYTVLSLWIIAAPIVVDPGAAPAAAMAR
ncbi:MAG: hypothetical protein ACRDFY_08250 [Candidatus Limnocylindria bacterium]